jgi:RNA polymerase sigma factor (sigma-70 family)
VSIHSGRTRPPPRTASDDFDEFFRHERVRATRLAWLLTRSSTAAEDITQEAMWVVQRRFASLDSPAAYLTRTIVNRCRSWSRAERRRQVMQRRVAPPEPAGDPADSYLVDAIARLPYRQRVVIVARYWGGWTETEIAEALGCRPGTVKSLASRALARMRQEVER